jgi:hypothetical protein
MSIKDRVTAMKRALADVLLLLAATVVVFLAVIVLVVILQPQNNARLDWAYVVRASSIVVALVKLDEQAAACFGAFVGLALIGMTRLICRLPRRQWELSVAVKRLRRPHRGRPSLSGLDLPPAMSSLQKSQPQC